jgi:outer membrane protein TolC
MLQNPTLFTYIPSMSLGIMDYLNSAAVSVAMPIYTGGRIRNGNKLAGIGEEVSICQKEMTTNEVIAKTEEYFWTLQSFKEKEKTIKTYQTMLDSLARDVENYTKAGLAQQNDLLKVKLKQNELKTNLFKLKNGIEMTKRALCQHIGLVYDTSLVFNPKNEWPTEAIELTDPSQLVQNRSEYKMLNAAVDAQKLQKNMARGEFMPQLALVGAGFTYDAMDKTSGNAMLMLNLSIPISDWWGGSHKIKQQKIKMDEAQSNLEENTELMVLQIRQGANEISETQYQIRISQESVKQAAENLRVSEDNYKAGVIGISDLLEAQAVFQQAMDNQTDAQCQLQIKIAKYKSMTGKL